MTFIDLSGNKFGHLTVINRHADNNSQGRVMWVCKCDCGKEFITAGIRLTRGITKSCGCKQHRISELQGQRFGKLTVVGLSDKRNHKNKLLWECVCDCGKKCLKTTFNLKQGKTRSCGCLFLERSANLNKSHGGYKDALFKTYNGIKSRCYSINTPNYKLYGARGVVMCEEWLNDFNKFKEWALANGWKKGLRIDKDKKAIEAGIEPLIYSPEWCSVLTTQQNCQRKRNSILLTYNGETKNASEWSKELGINKATLLDRIKANWPVERAFIPGRPIKNTKR